MVKNDWKTEMYGPRGRYVYWLWHALFDGTWLCYCRRSKEMKSRRINEEWSS